jgi:4-hydroxybenzoate polyprenyltransferase
LSTPPIVTTTTADTSRSARPLCVDMDGTLLATDLLWESLLVVLKTRPLLLLKVPFWLLKGRAFLKRQLASHVTLNPSLLPYDQPVLDFLAQEHVCGRELVLATASDRILAERVADHLGLFSAVLASDGVTNLKGSSKLDSIRRHLDGEAFDYLGNSTADLPIWRHATRALLARPSRALVREARRVATVDKVFWPAASRVDILARALRVHQWSKNALLPVPLLLAHQATDVDRLGAVVIAMGAFSLVASAMYLVNDLLDLEGDRQHPQKHQRPLACGLLSIPGGLSIASVALVAALAASALLLPVAFLGALMLYAGTTMAYSVAAKRIAIVDVLVLAGLYTLRVVAGAAATDVRISPWFLAFLMFFFLSLAFVKRYTELALAERGDRSPAFLAARGYLPGDLDLVRSVGPASGCLAVAVLALYINSPEVHILYRQPATLWLVCPLLLYWITRVWLIAQRAQMPGDPVVFALRDRTSYVLAGLIGGILVAATVGLPS